MAGDISALRRKPGQAIHQALRDALFDDALLLWKCLRAADPHRIETKSVSVFFDRLGSKHQFVTSLRSLIHHDRPMNKIKYAAITSRACRSESVDGWSGERYWL